MAMRTTIFWYANPNNEGKFELIGWGTDSTFTAKPASWTDVPDSVQTRGIITEKLYNLPAGRARYYEALDDFLETKWQPEKYISYIESTSELLRPHLVAFSEETFDANIEGLKTYIAEKTTTIAASRVDGEPENEAGLRTLPCRTPLGSVSGHVKTTWDTLGESLYSVGDAALTINDGSGATYDFTSIGAKAGAHASGRARFIVSLLTDEDIRFYMVIMFPDTRFFEGHREQGVFDLTVPPYTFSILHDDLSPGGLGRIRSMSPAEGTINIHAFGLKPGDPIEFDFNGQLFQNP